ncbi:hypothetical protein PG984_005538 [Apiospora sp. TS-2023a]
MPIHIALSFRVNAALLWATGLTSVRGVVDLFSVTLQEQQRQQNDGPPDLNHHHLCYLHRTQGTMRWSIIDSHECAGGGGDMLMLFYLLREFSEYYIGRSAQTTNNTPEYRPLVGCGRPLRLVRPAREGMGAEWGFPRGYVGALGSDSILSPVVWPQALDLLLLLFLEAPLLVSQRIDLLLWNHLVLEAVAAAYGETVDRPPTPPTAWPAPRCQVILSRPRHFGGLRVIGGFRIIAPGAGVAGEGKL